MLLRIPIGIDDIQYKTPTYYNLSPVNSYTVRTLDTIVERLEVENVINKVAQPVSDSLIDISRETVIRDTKVVELKR